MFISLTKTSYSNSRYNKNMRPDVKAQTDDHLLAATNATTEFCNILTFHTTFSFSQFI